jgi:hypothetical protein
LQSFLHVVVYPNHNDIFLIKISSPSPLDSHLLFPTPHSHLCWSHLSPTLHTPTPFPPIRINFPYLLTSLSNPSIGFSLIFVILSIYYFPLFTSFLFMYISPPSHSNLPLSLLSPTLLGSSPLPPIPIHLPSLLTSY